MWDNMTGVFIKLQGFTVTLQEAQGTLETIRT